MCYFYSVKTPTANPCLNGIRDAVFTADSHASHYGINYGINYQYLAHTLLGIPYDEVNVENSYPVPGTKTPGVQPGHIRDTVQ